MNIPPSIPSRRQHRALFGVRACLVAGIAAVGVAAGPACADTTYTIDRPIGAGGVTGTIVTDGKTGTLSLGDIFSWNLTLTGPGASITLTSLGNESLARLVGGDLIVTGRNLTFNFSGTDDGFFSFQANPGIDSGEKYWCNSTIAANCAQGESVVPEAFNSASAQYVPTSGVQVLGVGGPLQGASELVQSLLLLAKVRQAQMITNNLFSSMLLGFNEQVSCSDCAGADAMFGSFNIGAHGRHSLTDQITLLGGGSIGKFEERGANVSLTGTLAAGIRFDPAHMGSSRPFFEVGGSATPRQNTSYARPYTYDIGSSLGIGFGKTHSAIWNVYGRVGWVDRVTKRDEVAASISVSKTWQNVKRYSEAENDAIDPLNLGFASGTDQMTVVGVVGQYTHLFGRRIEIGLTGGWQRSIDSKSGIKADLGGGTLDITHLPNQSWAVFGGRLGIRINSRLTADAIVDGTSGSGIGTSVHGGVGFRLNL